MKSCRRTALAALASLAVVSSSAGAQARFATLRGTITDSTRPLATAVVQLFGTKRSVTTSESGSFAFDSLPPGRYWIGVPPGVSINGSAPWPGTSLRDHQLDDVEAVEVYRHAGMVPAEFSRAAACGLVVLWLR
jgi:hypothetical protein